MAFLSYAITNTFFASQFPIVDARPVGGLFNFNLMHIDATFKTQ